MKILFLSDNFPPEVNAVASRVYERAVYWAKWGHDVTVITCAPNFPIGKVYPGYKNKWKQVEMMNGVKVVRVKTYIAKNEGFVKRTLDFISYMVMAVFHGASLPKPDVVVSTSPQFFTAVGGYLLSRIKRRPFVFEIGDLWPESIRAVGALQNDKIYNAIERLELHLYRKSKLIMAQTPAFKDNLVSRGVEEEKIRVVMNGVDTHIYKPQAKCCDILHRFHLSETDFVVGYVGTHGMAHDLHTILQAAELLKDQSAIQFRFVGEGAAKADLIKYQKSNDLKNVEFISAVSKNEMPAVWSVCDVILIPLKDSATFATVVPSKLFEAMAMAKVIVLMAPEGQASAIVQKHQCGEWLKPGNPEDLSKTLLTLLHDADGRKLLSQNALEASGFYTRENQAKQFIEGLQTMLTDN